MLTPEATETPIPLTGEVRPKIGPTAQRAPGPLRMTPVGRDWPKGYERGLDYAAISAILRIQKAGRAVHLGNVGTTEVFVEVIRNSSVPVAGG